MNRLSSITRCLHHGGVLRRGRAGVLRDAITTNKEDRKGKGRIPRSQKATSFLRTSRKSQLLERSTLSGASRSEPKGARKRSNTSDNVEKSQSRSRLYSITPDDVLKSNKRDRRGSVLVIDKITAERMLLYKDDDIIVLNKPSGLAVHSGPRMKDDLLQYLHYWKYDASELPQLAHRLDKDTSGVLLLTRHTEAARRLAKIFQERVIIKKYWAITVNVPDAFEGLLKIPLAVKNIATSTGFKRHTMNRVVLRMDKMEEFSDTRLGRTLSGGVQMAVTKYRVLSVSQHAPRRCCFMEVTPVTGFKHQIRVHLADALMCPILGDHKFAGPLFRSSSLLKMKVKALNCFKSPLHLHAREVIIPNYYITKGKPLIVKATPPGHFVRTAKLQGLDISFS